MLFCAYMDRPVSTHPHPHTFILKLWLEDNGAGRPWRGQLQLIPDGRICYFCDWNTLARLLEALPSAHDPEVRL